MGKKLSDVWLVNGIEVPVHVYIERRRGKRVSVTKTGINIRIPTLAAKLNLRADLQWARQWIDRQALKTPAIIDQFKLPDFADGYIIPTPIKEYTLKVNDEVRATSTGRLKGDTIALRLNQALTPADRTKSIRSICARVIGKDQHARISQRIHEINDDCFGQAIKDIKIKNNSSNWGSCSTTGNINISIKTLLAPLWVQDYIFVHELAHRIEMNHSKD